MNVSPRIEEPGALAISAGAFVAMCVLVLGLATMGFAGLLGLGEMQGAYLLLIPAAMLGAFLSWLNERIWVYVALLGHLAVFLTSFNEGVGAGDVIFSALTLSGLCVWLFKETVIHRRFIVQSGFDALLIAVFVTTSIVALIGNQLHDGDFLHYILEWMKWVDLLLYFPLRRFIRSNNDVVRLVVVFALIGITMGIEGVATYRERLMKAVFQFQVESSRVSTNEPISMAYAILGSVIVAYANKRWVKIAGLLVTVSGLLFLVVTFSRGAIASAAIGIVFVGFVSGHGRRLLGVVVFSLVVAASGVYLAFPNIADALATSVGKRIASIGAASTDVSFNLRVIEANTLLDHYIPFSPIIGHGYGVKYHWYDPTERISMNHSFIHNGYVKLPFKFGYPLAVFILFFMMYPLLRVGIKAPPKRDYMKHAMMVGSVAYLICALVNNYVSDMYSHWAGPLNFVLCWSILDYVNRTTAPARQSATSMGSPTEPQSPIEPLAIARA